MNGILQILALSGSLRAQSSNSRLLRVARQLAPAAAKITIFEGIGELPHFNPDLDGEAPPPAITAFRARLAEAEAVVICTPEYAHGLPGSFKNALDWTVSSGEWMDKPVLIFKSSRSHFAHDSLVEILTTIMARVRVCEVFLPGNQMDEAAMLRDAALTATLRSALRELAVGDFAG